MIHGGMLFGHKKEWNIEHATTKMNFEDIVKWQVIKGHKLYDC